MAQPKSESGQAVNTATIAVYKGKVKPGEFHKHKPLRRSEPPHEGSQPSSPQTEHTGADYATERWTGSDHQHLGRE